MSRRRFLLGTVLGVLFALGWWVGGSHAARGLYTGLDLFVEVLETVKANYVDPVETGKLVTGAMRGVAHGLDPWSRYLDPEQFRNVRGTIQGAFDGIGASVDQRGGWPVVIAPIEGSPAWDAGVLPGDIITKIDGRSTFGLSPDEVSTKLRGAAGTKLLLTVAREDGGPASHDASERDIELMRRRVNVKNVPYAFIAAPGVGYLRLAHFSAHAALDVAAALDSLRGVGARALVLDLRGNPGGTIDESVAIASQFLPAGARITSTAGRANGASRDYDAKAARSELGWPLAVLVDGGSASASEILAGALQDHDRAVLVGDTTFGKGVAKQFYPLRGSLGALQLTVSRYLTPSGRSIQRERLMAAAEDAEDEEGEADGSVAPRDSVPAAGRSFRTDGGRVVRAGMGLAPDVHVSADSMATRLRVNAHHPGGAAGAARDALAKDPVFQRALEVMKRSTDARGVFAAAGLKPPAAAGGARR